MVQKPTPMAVNRAIELYRSGDKLGAALRYMEDVAGPSFLSAVEMTGPLDVWQRVEGCVDTVLTVDFPRSRLGSSKCRNRTT